MVYDFNAFLIALRNAGFSGAAGGGDDGVFNLFRHVWDLGDGSGLPWHTDDPDTDPWEWRMRVLNECDDIAYAKVFLRKAGYITREWYAYFIAARRGTQPFEDAYQSGTASRGEKRIYDTITDYGKLPVHEIKRLGRFSREDSARFERALTDLQMKLYITMCGGERKVSKKGEAYGWFSTVFCKTEDFWPPDVFNKAATLTRAEATEVLSARILALHPEADKRKILKVVAG